MSDAQLSLHGFREAVKFFIEYETDKLSKVAAGGVGYIDFRYGVDILCLTAGLIYCLKSQAIHE